MSNFENALYCDSGNMPAEAMKINGEYIENLIPGYRTIHVSGRELFAPEVSTYETGIRDGSELKNKRYPDRTLTVKYSITATSNAAFRTIYNNLNKILDTEEAELIFDDEPDKFFIGTPISAKEVDPARNVVTGEFEILCTDPFKYSVQEYEVSPTLDDETTFAISYNGTYRSFPTLEATFFRENEVTTDEDGDETENSLTGSGDCGFVAFMNEREKIIQLGDPDEPDTEDYQKSQTLLSQVFSSYGVTVAALWPVNVGKVSSTAIVQTGMVSVGSDGTSAGTKMIRAGSYGSGSKHHGPSITRTIPADESGHIGAKDFRFTYKQRMCLGTGKNASKERGVFQCMCVNKNGSVKTIVAGIAIFKTSAGNKAILRFYVNGKAKGDMKIDITKTNKYFGFGKTIAAVKNKKGKVIKNARKIKPVLTSCIQKSGKKVTFNIAGIKKVFTDSAVANIEIHETTFYFGRYASNTALTTNGLYWAKLVSDACDTFRDIPNKFSANDVVVADCEEAEIYLNDNVSPELGALGNDWEDFYLIPGTNQIGVAWSDWVPAEQKPTFKMRYREVFL